MNNSDFNKKTLITYCILSLFFCGLSCIALMFNEWIIIPCCVVCSLLGFVVCLLFVKATINPDDEKSKAGFLGMSAVRYLLMAVGLVASALLIYLTMDKLEPNSKRYIMLVIAAIPYFFPSLSILIAGNIKSKVE